MKRSKLLMVSLAVAFLFLTYLIAKAGKSQYNKQGSRVHSANTGQPINSYVYFLIITGAAIGYKVVTDKTKH